MAQEPSEYSKIASQFATAKAKAEREKLQAPADDDKPASAAVQFKTRHILSLVFFFWILYV